MDDTVEVALAPSQYDAGRSPETIMRAIAAAVSECGPTESSEEALIRAEREIATLKEALITRTVIAQATGLLMAEQNLSSDQAFAHLQHLSSHTNVKVRDIAVRLVGEANARNAISVATGQRPGPIERPIGRTADFPA